MAPTIQLGQYLDVTVSEDKMQAYLHFTKFDEAFQCTAEELEALLSSQGIRYGILSNIIRELAMQPEQYRSGMTKVAEGLSPVHGTDGKIKLLTSKMDSTHRPLEHANGKVDLKEINALNNVKKGERIAERIPAVAGVPGMDVCGDKIEAREGKEARFKIGKNVVVDDQQAAMYAAIDGLIVKTDRDKLNVFPVYEVNGDIDYRTGNIDFVGTVVIRGNVLTGFKVKAAGDIRVYGGVEGAHLEAGGSVEVIGGIIAGNKGHVQAGEDVNCIFMQEAQVTAGANVNVSQSILHSQVRAGKQVVCNGTKGLVVGGSIQAGDLVQARTIGNSMSTVTVIEVGVQPELRNELNQLRVKMKDSMTNLEKTEKALRILDPLASNGQLNKERMAMRLKLNLTKKQLVEEQTEIRERIFEIEKMLEQTGVARIDAFQHVYGGSKIVIGRSVRFVKDVCKHVSFRLIDGEVSMYSI
ncbi:DUF342 domain-containing protein [Paenibacillus marinisediminis]